MSIVQNDTSPIGLYITDSTTNLPATGKTVTVLVQKAGGAFAAGAGTVVEAGHGWYDYTPTAGEVDTLGELKITPVVSGGGCWEDPFVDRVVQAGAAASDWTSARAAKVDTIDTNVTAVKAKTDNLPTDPADESLIIAATDAIQAAIAALNNLNAAGVRAAIGLAAANLDTQLAAIPTAAENAAELILEAATTPLAADIQKVNGVTIVGDGSSTPWGA